LNEKKDKMIEWMSDLSTDSLKRIVEKDYNDYEDYAIEIANEEINKRNIKIMTHFCTFMDLIQHTEFELVENAIRTSYPDQTPNIERHKEVYDLILHMVPNEENRDYLIIEDDNSNYIVKGRDAKTGEKFGVEFYKWSDWIAFLVIDEQINYIGKAEYVSICLMAMTQYGFSEEEIQLKFSSMETMNFAEGNKPENIEALITRNHNISFDKMIDRVIDFKHEVIEKRREEHESSQVRPWVRFWARTIDTTILGLLLGYVWISFIPEFYSLARNYALGYVYSILNFLVWALIEAYFLSKWGCTPGKWILNIKVSDNSGNNLSYSKAIKRVMLVLFYGEGLLIPFVSFIANIIAYFKLTDSGITKWDKKMEVVVSHNKIEIYKVLLAVLIIIGVQTISFIMYRTITYSY